MASHALRNSALVAVLAVATLAFAAPAQAAPSHRGYQRGHSTVRYVYRGRSCDGPVVTFRLGSDRGFCFDRGFRRDHGFRYDRGFRRDCYGDGYRLPAHSGRYLRYSDGYRGRAYRAPRTYHRAPRYTRYGRHCR